MCRWFLSSLIVQVVLESQCFTHGVGFDVKEVPERPRRAAAPRVVQGYLAYKKPPLRRTLQQDHT